MDMDRCIRLSILSLLIIVLSGCGISRKVADMQSAAEAAFNSQNYPDALDSYEEIIALIKGSNREVSGEIYYMAGVSAWELEQTRKAVEYLVQAGRNNFDNENRLYILAMAYREIDNLSLEITSLENYAERHPGGEKITGIRQRLFETYVESNNNLLAMELWKGIEEESSGNPELLEAYFILNRNMGNEVNLKTIADQLYRLDNDNTLALNYLGEYYFWIAENRYQEEMAAYEKNHTRSQYRLLLDALDVINGQFRVSRNYFDRLWKIDPSPNVAIYLRNIYLRFGNEERAAYYHNRAGVN